MNYQTLRQLKLLFFSYSQVAECLDLSLASAKVLCSRYHAKGLLVRIKRNIYVLRERWDNLRPDEIFQLANVIQVPSYISLTSALAFHEYTTQIQQGFVESVSVTRTYIKSILDIEFNFTKVNREHYHHFEKRQGFFIATPEKALADALYLVALGRYQLDFSALELAKFDVQNLEKILNLYPEKVKRLWNTHETD
jgi:predicted transcriptional regulator of viral defense system